MYCPNTESTKTLFSTLNPRATLEWGYAIVEKGNAIVTGMKDVALQDIVRVTLSDGVFEAEVK